MATFHNPNVVPDNSLLSHIFGKNVLLRLATVRQDGDRCVFKALVLKKLEHGQNSCFVRLRALDKPAPSFYTVAAMQKIAASCIKHLVPATIKIGEATNDQGRKFQFWVMELGKGIALDNIWEKMDHENRKSVVKNLVEVLFSLQSLKISDYKVQNTFQESLGEHRKEELTEAVKASFGGPLSGFLETEAFFMAFLLKVFGFDQPFKNIFVNRFNSMKPESDPAGIVLECTAKHVDSIRINDDDMRKL